MDIVSRNRSRGTAVPRGAQLGRAFQMTMPHERCRALRWGAELLERLEGDPDLPEAIRAQAGDLCRTYPTAEQLKAHLAAGTNGLPPSWTSAIQQAHRLFNTLWCSGDDPPAIRDELKWVMRHYPDPYTTALMGDERVDIRRWLVHEDSYR